MSNTTELLCVCPASEIEDGRVHRREVAGVGTLAVYRVTGAFYVSDDLCTHGQASLSDEGTLEGHVIVCGWHGGSFDVRTGEPVDPPCIKALRTYRVEVIDGLLHIARP